MKKFLTLILTLSLILTLFSFPTEVFGAVVLPSSNSSKVYLYPEYPEQLNRDYDYEVTVSAGGKTETIPVYNPCRLNNSFNSAKDTDSWRRFCEFSFEGEITVSVKTKLKISSYSVLPSSAGISSTFNTDTITFKLTKPQNVIVRLNDDQNTVLCIFAEAPEEFDYQAEIDQGRKVIYFDAGYNNLNEEKTTGSYSISHYGQIRIYDDTTLYLAPGALVPYRLIAKNDNVKIMGRGAIIDPRLDRASSGESHMILATRDAGGGVVYDDYVDNFYVEGIRVLDAYCFNIDLTYVQGASIQNVKVLSNEISTDGVTIRNYCSNVTVDNCFLYVNDNNIVVTEANENIVVKNSIFGSSHALMYPQGTTTSFTAQNIDVFRLATFFKVQEKTAIGGSWNVTAKNIRAADALTMGYFIYIQNQGTANTGVANFQNVSLPAVDPTVAVRFSSGFTMNVNNLYFGSTLLNSTSKIKTDSDYPNPITYNFGATANPTLAGVGVDKHSASYSGAPSFKIGGYTVPYDKNVVQNIDGTNYFPANNLLKELGYTVSQQNDTLLITDANGSIKLTQNGANVYGVDVKLKDNAIIKNGAFMLPTSLLEELFDLTINGTTVTPFYADNLLEDPSFENIRNTNFPNPNKYAHSTSWTHYRFGGLFENEDAHSGSTSVLVNIDNDQIGLAQFISNEIQKYGAGTYRFECYAKVHDSDTTTTTLDKSPFAVDIGIAQAGYRVYENGSLIGINSVKSYTLNDSWQKITHDVTITNPTADGYDRAFFFVGKTTSDSVSVLVDDASVTFVKTVSNSSQLKDLLNSPVSTQKNELFKGWYDQNGNLYTTASAVSGEVKLHPEFIYTENLTNPTTDQKVLSVNGVDRLPSEYGLGVHYWKGSTLVDNIMDSQGDQSIQAHKNLKNGVMVLPYATTYYSQARFYDNGWKENGIWFEPFTASSAPNGYTSKTVSMQYNKNKKVFYIPRGVTLFVGDTVLFDTENTLTDPCPTPESANYTNGMYLQGAQLRIGEGVSTALRFVTVNNTDLINNLSAHGFKNVTFGTLVSKTNAFENGYQLTFADVSKKTAADVKAQNIYQTSTDLTTNYQKYTACVVNIPSTSFKTNIYARPYVKYTDLSGVEHILYGEQYKTNLYAVAEMAYNDEQIDSDTKQLIYNQILSK